MVKYTIGIVFSYNFREVLLIEKNRPERHKGKWNFPGGHIEKDELYDDSVSREIKEECNIYIPPREWKYIGKIINPANYKCFFFTAIYKPSSHGKYKAMEDQPIDFFNVDELPINIISNLKWLVPYALNTYIPGEQEILIKGKFNYTFIHNKDLKNICANEAIELKKQEHDEPKPAIKQKLKLKDLKEVTVEELQDNAKYILQNKYKNNFWKGDTLTDDINKADRVDKNYILRWLRDQGKTSFPSTLIFETPENEADMLSEVQKELLGRRFWLPGSDRIHVLTKNPKYPLYFGGLRKVVWGRNAGLNHICLVNSYGEKLYVII